VQLLLQYNRVSDALLVARTCLKLDPYNGQVMGLVQNLSDFESRSMSLGPLETEYRANPANFPNALNLAAAYIQSGRSDVGLQVLDAVLNHPKVDAAAVLAVAQAHVQLQNWAKLEAALVRLTQVTPESAEAWYDLAALKANLGKNPEAITALTKALALKAKENLVDKARTDLRFNTIRAMPEFQKLVPPK
jgi:tetratricopeptide (TPR) repeat protein